MLVSSFRRIGTNIIVRDVFFYFLCCMDVLQDFRCILSELFHVYQKSCVHASMQRVKVSCSVDKGRNEPQKLNLFEFVFFPSKRAEKVSYISHHVLILEEFLESFVSYTISSTSFSRW